MARPNSASSRPTVQTRLHHISQRERREDIIKSSSTINNLAYENVTRRISSSGVEMRRQQNFGAVRKPTTILFFASIIVHLGV